MRTKDERKRQALIAATVKVVNEIGFASSSVAKIAKQAKVSPSTLYVFFKNKDELLVSIYIELKQKLAAALLADFDDSLPIRDIIRNAWHGTFAYISKNLDEYDYMEQFANSPYSALVDSQVIEKEFMAIIQVFQRGIEQKIIKDVDLDFLAAFIWSPMYRLANPRLSSGLGLGEKGRETAFNMAWDAIKL